MVSGDLYSPFLLGFLYNISRINEYIFWQKDGGSKPWFSACNERELNPDLQNEYADKKATIAVFVWNFQ